MSCDHPFFVKTLLMTCAVVASMLLASPLSAQVVPANQQAALSQNAKADPAKPGNSEAKTPVDAPTVATAPNSSANVAATDPANPTQPKSITSKAIDKVRQVA